MLHKAPGGPPLSPRGRRGGGQDRGWGKTTIEDEEQREEDRGADVPTRDPAEQQTSVPARPEQGTRPAPQALE
eukprot:4126253-Pyramimonas_sp.AAC.1